MQTLEGAVCAPGHMYAASLPRSPRSGPCHCLTAPHTVQPRGSVSTASLSPEVDLPNQGRWLPAHSPAKNSTWDDRESPTMRGKHSHLVWGKGCDMWSCRRCPAQGTGILLPGDAEKSGDTEASLSFCPSWPQSLWSDKGDGAQDQVSSPISPSLSAEVRIHWLCPASLARITGPLRTPS